MGAHRFFVNNFDGVSASIQGEDFDHAVTVLRLKTGDTVNIFNYESGEFEAEITGVDPGSREITLKAIRLVKQRSGSNAKITAMIAVIKKDNMEFVIEKMTELGIDRIVPVVTKRTVVKIKEEEKKIKRWESIIYSAVKQCGRLSPPELADVVEGVENINTGAPYKFFIYEKAEGKFLMDEALKIDKAAGDACFIIGPEGGFEDSEAAVIESKGFIPVSIGDTILRAETAAIAAGTVLVQALRRGSWKN